MAQIKTLEVSEVRMNKVTKTLTMNNSYRRECLVVLQVQGQVAHHGLPPLLLLHAGRLHGALLSPVCPEEVPGVREGRGAGLHTG